MRSFYPILFAVAIMAVFGLIEIFLIKILNKEWWKYRTIKYGSLFLPVLGVIAVGLWFTGMSKKIDWLSGAGALTTTITLILLLGLMISLPLSGILNVLNRFIEKRRTRNSDPDLGPSGRIDEHRRLFLKGTAAALPMISLALGTDGIAGSFSDTHVYLRRMIFPDLPAGLENFRILHITDSHLGLYKFNEHIKAILQSAREYNPDLILMTGDIADYMDLLPETLKLVENFGAPFGAYSIPGNHEYYRGIQRFIDCHNNSIVNLLIDNSALLDINGTPLFIAGADDPRGLGGEYVDRLNKSVIKSMTKKPDNSFNILMSHRPQALDKAAELGADLTLSGHTHGGQVGFGHRSFFEKFMPDNYLWGEYNIGKSHMYVSCGIGHWFPFRLNCRPEAPIIELASK